MDNRIEGTACLDGNHVVFGSHDHFIYFADALTGEIVFKYLTGDIVKSKPSVDSFGNIWCNSYDCKTFVFKNLSLICFLETRKPCFASPVIADDFVILSSINGDIYLCKSFGIVRILSFDSPIFSTPCFVKETKELFVAHVDGTIRIFLIPSMEIVIFLYSLLAISLFCWRSYIFFFCI